MDRDDKKSIYKNYVSVTARGKLMAENNFKTRSFEFYFRKFLPENKQIKILDLGCGDGAFLFWLQKHNYNNIIGVDVSSEQIKKAKNMGINRVVEADVFDWLREHSDEYDLIVVNDLLEHFTKSELRELLELIYNSLKPGGQIFITVPNASSLLAGRIRYGDFTHETSFTYGSLVQILKLARFDSIFIFSRRPIVHDFKSAVRFLLWGMVEILLRVYLLIESGSVVECYTPIMSAVAQKPSQHQRSSY